MDFRNKYLLNTIRVLLGLFMIFSGVSGFLSSPEDIPEPMRPNMAALADMGIFHMIKITEIVAGLMLVVGFLPALASIFLAPVAVGVIVVNARTAPAFLPMGILFALLLAYLGYAYWPKYQALFERK